MTSEQPQEPGQPEGDQETFLPPEVPEWAVVPPNSDQFANATWLKVGPEIDALISEVLDFEEFKEIGTLYFMAVWRRRTKPTRGDDEPVFASVEIVRPRIVWTAYQEGNESFPRYFIDLHWQHFEDEREESQYVHGDVLKQHIHHALSALSVDNDILTRQSPDFTGFANTIKRFGLWTSGARRIAQQLKLWPNPEE